MTSKRIFYTFYLFILLFLSLTSCTSRRKGGLPASTGQPYEVVLEGDTDNIVEEMLTEDIPALPQPEPLCNLIRVNRGQVKGTYLLVRTRVIVTIGKNFSVKLSHDENASPQTIIRITAISAEELRKKLNGEKLRQIIDESECKHLASIIKQNPEKQQEVKRLFGITMKIPASMNASMTKKDFAWYSNNATRGMQNLLLMRVKGKIKTDAFIKQQIDSILHKNMLGETDGMYMQLGEAQKQSNGILQGLWDMKGDAMGGPYRMRTIKQKEGYIVIIGFVYAPEMNKRNLTKQLEAVLTTIK